VTNAQLSRGGEGETTLVLAGEFERFPVRIEATPALKARARVLF
jgi:hypothetical protein